MNAASLFADLGFSAISVLLILFLALVLSAYVKIVTVLSIVRIGLGAGSLPSAFVTGGLALVLSFFVMYPTLIDSSRVMDSVVKKHSVVNDQVRARAVNAGMEKWKTFLRTHAHKSEVERFSKIADRFDSPEELQREKQKEHTSVALDSWRILAPAFLVSELKEAFATGLSLFLPFLVIDLLVANVLAGVGLERMSPSSVSFPFKLLLFVMADGWTLITTNLVATYV